MIEGDLTLKEKCKQMEREIKEGVKEVLEEQAVKLTETVRNRIRSSGNIPQKKLSDYSEKGKHTHKKDRIRKGLQVEYKDLTFTGSMLDGLQPKKAVVKSMSVSVDSDVSNKKKSGRKSNAKVHTVIVEKLGEQEKLSEGTIIDATKEELQEAYKHINDWLIDFIKTKLQLS